MRLLLFLSIVLLAVPSHAAKECSDRVDPAAHARALEQILKLPVTQERMAQMMPGEAMANSVEGDETLETEGACFWAVSLYLHQANRLDLWRTFLVSLDGRSVFVEDATGERLQPVRMCGISDCAVMSDVGAVIVSGADSR